MMLQKLRLGLFVFGLSSFIYADDLPNDVQQFVDNRATCDHFRGEYPDPEGWGDAYQARLDEVNQAVKSSCSGTDEVLTKLKQKYKKDNKVIIILNTYETDIGL